MKTALLLGATGLVGSQLLELLLGDDRFGKVTAILRRKSGREHEKLEEIIVDFDNPEDWAGKVKGDVLFSAFGTTLKKAGSKEAQYKIDYHYQYLVARLAASNAVPDCILVSAPGADSGSRIFYNRLKGDLDRDVSKLGFDKLRIIQPSLLTGDRNETRTGEKIGAAIGNALLWIPGLRKYRPISGLTVAKAMINAYFDDISLPIVIYGLEKLHEMGRN
jgi:uncharacterized protein YbjT (DUF2867 family)